MANLIYLYNLANIDTKDFVIIKNEIVEDNFEVKNSPVSVDDNNFEEFEENDNDSDYVNGYESPAKPKRNPKIENFNTFQATNLPTLSMAAHLSNHFGGWAGSEVKFG